MIFLCWNQALFGSSVKGLVLKSWQCFANSLVLCKAMILDVFQMHFERPIQFMLKKFLLVNCCDRAIELSHCHYLMTMAHDCPVI
jgi:hypothetical protein